MDKKEHLKSMLTNLAKDDSESAEADLHKYMAIKMKEIVNHTESVDTSKKTEDDNNDSENMED